MRSRIGALLAVVALHGVALAAVWTARHAAMPATPAMRHELAVKLLSVQPRPAVAPAPLHAAAPALRLPDVAVIAPPAFEVVQAEARRLAEPAVAALVAAAPAPAPQPIAAPAPPAEPVSLQSARRAACAPAPHPPTLRDRGIEGVVRLRVWVDELGRAGQVLLAASSGWRLLDDAAMAQARRCPFHPAQRGSEPVGSWVEFPVRFALESSSNG
ncbi:energy transducer TonB [Pelomonas sp. Root1444]|uniref:energy transducer TonB n=1 Tax=Pelomonas sp. Root1444 TaxID=1736464 RepID=UPI000702407D|nr:energy transducer TonB [Pelomonas sp. Root1444]KQY88642.1 hypothetical protein ASD35_13905 [Pelomonas sp. Root1444]